MRRLLSILLCCAVNILLISCLNKYEKIMVGHYEVKTYKSSKGQHLIEKDFPRMILNSDRTLLVENGKDVIKGEWAVNDYGDFTLLEIFFHKELVGQAKFSDQGIINFDNYNNELFGNNFDDISFIKVR